MLMENDSLSKDPAQNIRNLHKITNTLKYSNLHNTQIEMISK